MRRNLLEEALRKYRSNAPQVANYAKKVCLGDLYFFVDPATTGIPVQFCVVLQHKDDSDLWFVVPGDQMHLIGTCDVEIPKFVEFGPMNFRCGNGLWVHTDDFNFEHRTGRMGLTVIEQCQDVLSRMVTGDLTEVEFIIENETHPDYVDWMKELQQAVGQLEENLQFKQSC